MSAVDDFATWSGWAFGAFGFAVSLESLRRAAAEKRRSRRMAEALSSRPVVRPPLMPGAKRTQEEQVRAFLVHAAAGNQPLYVVINRAKRLAITQGDVLALAEDLRRTGLLHYSGRVAPETILSLQR